MIRTGYIEEVIKGNDSLKDFLKKLFDAYYYDGYEQSIKNTIGSIDYHNEQLQLYKHNLKNLESSYENECRIKKIVNDEANTELADAIRCMNILKIKIEKNKDKINEKYIDFALSQLDVINENKPFENTDFTIEKYKENLIYMIDYFQSEIKNRTTILQKKYKEKEDFDKMLESIDDEIKD